jgi:putative ABC transport system permease protein
MEIRPILSTLGRHKTAAALIVLEIALACAIICNAMFMIGERVTQIGEISGVADNELVRVRISAIGIDDNPDATTRTDLAALRAIPGVKGATAMSQVPFGNSSSNTGIRLTQDQQRPTLSTTVYLAEDDFVETLGLKVVSGRDFEAGEYRNMTEVMKSADLQVPVALITRKMAEKLFPGENAVGKSFYGWSDEPTRVVGILDHLVRPSGQGGPEAHEYSMVLPLRPSYATTSGDYLLRAEPSRRAEVLKAAVAALRAHGAKRIVVDQSTKTMEALRDEYYQQQRSMAWLLGGVIVALLVVTALGIVGLASFWVEQRTRQIGVRRALGATKRQILYYFQLENFILATSGIVLGMVLAFGINQLLMEKYELPRLPWPYLPIGALALWALGQLSVLWPARRAAAVPPAVATRSA